MNSILQNLTMILNIVLIADVVLGLIIGFARGAFKAIFNAVCYILLLLAGFFLSLPIAQALMDVNISGLGISVNNVTIQTINEQTPEIMASLLNMDASVFSEGSAMLNLANGIETMVVRIAVLIVWVLLCATVFHWICNGIYAIIKPKGPKDNNGRPIKDDKGKALKPKVTFGSHCLGGLVGICHAGINIFLLVMILAGVISIGKSAMSISEATNATNTNTSQTAHAVIIMDPLMCNDEVDVAASDDSFSDLKAFIEQYEASYFHYVSDFKINNQSVALSTFDQVFTFTSEDQKVAIREELANAAEVCEIVSTDLGSMDTESLSQMDSETFNKIWAYIKNMDIIKVIIPVAIDYVDNSGLLQEMFGDDVTIDLVSTMEILKTLDYSSELDQIGQIITTLIDAGIVKAVLNSDGRVDIATLNITNATISQVLDNLSQMKLTDALGTIGLGYLISSESFNQFVSEYHIDKETLSQNLSQIKLSDEIKALKDIVDVLTQMNISLNDLSDIKNFDFNAISDDNLKALSNAIMESHLLSDNTAILTQIAINFIPTEYQSYFTAVKLDSTDLYNFICLAKMLINQGLLDGAENIDVLDVIAHLSSTEINVLANTIIDLSDLVDIDGLINFIAKQYVSNYLPNGFEGLDEIDWSADSGRQELVTLFTIVQNIVASGAIKDNSIDFSVLDTDALASLLSQSVIIKNNISPIIENVLKSNASVADIKLNLLSSDEWTADEFKHLFSVVKVVNEIGVLKSDFSVSSLNLSDSQMTQLATALTESQFISLNMAPITQYLIQKLQLNISLPSLTQADFTYDEYMSIFKLVNVANEMGVLKSDFTLETLSLSDSEIDELAEALAGSNIIKHNLAGVLTTLLEKNNITITLDIDESYLTVNEYKALFHSAMALKETGLLSGSLDFSTVDTDTLAHELAQSQIIMHNFNSLLKLAVSKIDGLSDIELVYLDSYSEDELKWLLASVKDILGTSLLEGDFNLTDEQIDKLSQDFSESSFIKANLTPILKKILADNSAIPHSIIDALPLDWVEWNYTNIKGLLTAAKVCATQSSDLTSLAQVDDATLTTMLKSSILTNALKAMLVEETTSGSLKDILVLSDTSLAHFGDTYEGDTLVEKGELHRLMDTLKVILNQTSLSDVSQLDVNTLLGIDSATLCQSRIIEDTAVNYIKKSASDSLKDYLVINITDEAWYDQYDNNVRTEGELGYLLDGLKALLGSNGDIDQLTQVTLNTLLTQVDMINQSAILSDSMINIFTTQAGSALVIPDSYNNQKTSYDKALWTTGGEFKRLLTALSLLVGQDQSLNEINVDSFELGTILKNDEVLLQSVIVEASAIHYVQETLASNTTIIIPTDMNTYTYLSQTTYYPNHQLVWEQTSTDDGELRALLNALKVVLDLDGDGNYSDIQSLTCDMNLFMTLSDSQIQTICNSRVMEATIVQVVSPIISTGSLAKYITQPSAGFNWYRSANEQKPYRTFPYICGLLRGLVALKNAGIDYNNITFVAVMNADSTAVAKAFYSYSEILRNSLPQFLNTLVDDQVATLPSMVQDYTRTLLSSNTKYVYESSDFTSETDVKDELDKINTILNS